MSKREQIHYDLLKQLFSLLESSDYLGDIEDMLSDFYHAEFDPKSQTQPESYYEAINIWGDYYALRRIIRDLNDPTSEWYIADDDYQFAN